MIKYNEPYQLFCLLISLLVLFLFSMFFSSAETAFLSLNKLRLRFLQEQKYHAAILAGKVLQNKQNFLSTILIGNSIVNIAISSVLTASSMQLFGQAGLAIAVAAGTVLVLIFGEIIPKSLALVHSDSISFVYARFILFIMTFFAPVVKLFSFITGMLLYFCGIRNKAADDAITEADLKDFFEASEEKGLIGADEHSLLNNILQYGDMSARTIMTPRRNMVTLSIDSSLREIIDISQKSYFSSFPVYDTDIDSVKGIFYLKDLFLAFDDIAEPFQLRQYMRPAVFVFETAKLVQLEQIFHTEKQNMAIVLDEYGGTAGLVTVEDIQRELFGAVADECDGRSECKNIHSGRIQQPYPATTVFPCAISGDMRLNELNEWLGLHIKSDFHTTIGGYLMEIAGEIPSCGYALFVEPYTFIVTVCGETYIDEIKITI